MQVTYNENGLIDSIISSEKDDPKQVKKMRDRMHKQINFINTQEDKRVEGSVKAAFWGYAVGVAVTTVCVIADMYIKNAKK